MIKSVGAGSEGLTNQSPRRTKTEPRSPFPKINEDPLIENLGTSESSVPQPLMVGVKAKAHLTSILDEQFGVFRTNADGDKLEVSKKAITLAKDRFFN